jgi:membrane protein required for colicin V production
MRFSFAPIDIVFIIIIIALIIRAGLRGFVAEILTMAAPILGIALAIFCSNALAQVVKQITGSDSQAWNQIIAFLVIFIVIYLLVKIFQSLIQKGIDKLKLEKADKVLGIFLGLLEGLLITGVLIFIAHWLPFTEVKDIIKDGFFYNLLAPLLPVSSQLIESSIMVKIHDAFKFLIVKITGRV